MPSFEKAPITSGQENKEIKKPQEVDTSYIDFVEEKGVFSREIKQKKSLDEDVRYQEVLKSLQKESNTPLSKAQSFSELFTSLEERGAIAGSDGYQYTADKLKTSIEKVRKGEITIEHITRSEGLRDAVIQLMGQEKTRSKVVSEKENVDETKVPEKEFYKQIWQYDMEMQRYSQKQQPNKLALTQEKMARALAERYPDQPEWARAALMQEGLNTESIRRVQSIRELLNLFQEKGGGIRNVPMNEDGSRVKDVKEVYEGLHTGIMQGEKGLEQVTPWWGLREKVKDLLEIERIQRKSQ